MLHVCIELKTKFVVGTTIKVSCIPQLDTLVTIYGLQFLESGCNIVSYYIITHDIKGVESIKSYDVLLYTAVWIVFKWILHK